MTKGNYRIVVSYDSERQVFGARAPELGQCSAEGATRAEALAKVEEEIAAQLANIAERGGRAPHPIDETECDGSLTVKVSKSLHRDLLWLANQEGIALDQLSGELLAAAAEAKRGGGRSAGPAVRSGNHAPRPDGNSTGRQGNGYDGNIDGRPRGSNHGARYMGILEDRANFIEYVRGLGQGGPQGGGNYRGGEGGRGGRNHNRRRRGGRPQGPGQGQPQREGGPREGEGTGGGGGAPGGGTGGGDSEGT